MQYVQLQYSYIHGHVSGCELQADNSVIQSRHGGGVGRAQETARLRTRPNAANEITGQIYASHCWCICYRKTTVVLISLHTLAEIVRC